MPTALADAASQAHICLSAGSPIGAVVVARAAVEAVAKDHGITGGDLKTKIERMHADGHITATMRDAAMEIRFAGNEAAHGDVVAADVVEERPAIEDAAEIVGLMDSILVYVYQEPARIAEIRYKREIREQDAHLKKLAGLQPGDQVKHETHGVGTVVSLEGEGDYLPVEYSLKTWKPIAPPARNIAHALDNHQAYVDVLEGEHVWEAFSVAGHYLGLIADSIYPSQWPASLSRADYEAR